MSESSWDDVQNQRSEENLKEYNTVIIKLREDCVMGRGSLEINYNNFKQLRGD